MDEFAEDAAPAVSCNPSAATAGRAPVPGVRGGETPPLPAGDSIALNEAFIHCLKLDKQGIDLIDLSSGLALAAEAAGCAAAGRRVSAGCMPVRPEDAPAPQPSPTEDGAGRPKNLPQRTEMIEFAPGAVLGADATGTDGAAHWIILRQAQDEVSGMRAALGAGVGVAKLRNDQGGRSLPRRHREPRSGVATIQGSQGQTLGPLDRHASLAMTISETPRLPTSAVTKLRNCQAGVSPKCHTPRTIDCGDAILRDRDADF